MRLLLDKVNKYSLMKKMEDEKNNLSASVDQLSDKVKKLSSFGRSFLQGIFFGLGSAIGAGIVAAILFGALNWFIHSTSGVPLFKNLQNIQLQK